MRLLTALLLLPVSIGAARGSCRRPTVSQALRGLPRRGWELAYPASIRVAAEDRRLLDEGTRDRRHAAAGRRPRPRRTPRVEQLAGQDRGGRARFWSVVEPVSGLAMASTNGRGWCVDRMGSEPRELAFPAPSPGRLYGRGCAPAQAEVGFWHPGCHHRSFATGRLRGRVFLGTQDGTVYALDAGTGCTHWATEAATQVRTGMVVAVVGGHTLVFFGVTPPATSTHSTLQPVDRPGNCASTVTRRR